MPFVHPIQFGALELPSNILFAPLAGCTDFPFRQMILRARPGLFFCEMVKMDALVRQDRGTFRLLDYSADMHPIGAQLCGSKPEFVKESARMIEDMGFDCIDFNCGCPVDKVTKEGCGSAMLKTPERIGEILSAMVSAVRIPVTVKVRVGWDDDSIVGPQVVRIAEDAGAQAITVHGRTRKQAYRGKADRGRIKDCVDAAKTIKVIGNGDIFDASSALSMMEETGCDGVLVARGSLGQPWIAEDIALLDRGSPAPSKTVEERRKALLLHMDLLEEYYPERKVVIDMRRIGCWYFAKSAKTRQFRKMISEAEDVEEIRDLVRNFSFEEGDEDGF